MINSSFLPIGTLLSCQYKILRQIGAGGYGQTYLVEDQLGMKKVVKELFISSMCTRDVATRSVVVSVSENKEIFQQQLDKFCEEARRIFSLSHKNIVKVSALFNENNTAYYVMDYIEGESLAQKSKRTPLTETQIKRYLDQLLSALEYIHSHGVTHLDLKPGNIMIDRNDNVVLIDFGASKLFNAQSVNKTMMTSMRPPFTPGYAPIEQENGNVKDMGPHCDIYALGATLYNLFTGKKVPSPFEILQNGLPPISNISSTMQEAIKKSMAVMVKDRIKNIDEFRRNIGTIINDKPTLKKITIKGISFSMIKVVGGSFMMGAQSVDPNGANYDPEARVEESPMHKVTLRDFYIGETKVQQGLWEAVMGSTIFDMNLDYSPYEGWDDYMFGTCSTDPMYYVSWDDCQEFVKRLNELTGQKFRLPTESEWEYAARGGNKISEKDRAWGDYFNEDVGLLPECNQLGIYSMNYGVSEWCSDWYGDYSIQPQINPKGPILGTSRIVRGGDGHPYGIWCSVAYRLGFEPSGRNLIVGFRLACDI